MISPVSGESPNVDRIQNVPNLAIYWQLSNDAIRNLSPQLSCKVNINRFSESSRPWPGPLREAYAFMKKPHEGLKAIQARASGDLNHLTDEDRV